MNGVLKERKVTQQNIKIDRVETKPTLKKLSAPKQTRKSQSNVIKQEKQRRSRIENVRDLNRFSFGAISQKTHTTQSKTVYLVMHVVIKFMVDLTRSNILTSFSHII